MAVPSKFRIGVADDPSALQPTLHDCLSAALEQAPGLMVQVVQGLLRGVAPGPQQVAAFKSAPVKATVLELGARQQAVADDFAREFARLVWEGGGKDQVATEVLRYEDLQLFGDAELDQSIEVARALQEVQFSADDVLPALDALISTLLGWRTVQPGLNPLRPEVAVRALQATLAAHVHEAPVREALIAPAGGLLGVQLRKLYRELADWLQSTGVEPAEPLGAPPAGAAARPPGAMARTLLTLDKLRKLLAGDFDPPPGKPEFGHTVPASMAMLQELRKVDVLVDRLEKRPRPAAPPPAQVADEAADGKPRLGRQLGEEVLRLMFESLAQDDRLLPAYKRELQALEPAVQKLAAQDSRVFSDRAHPARQLLERLTQRSLGFQSERDDGWVGFIESVRYAVTWVTRSKVVDADTFAELVEHLQDHWTAQEAALRQRREEAARALLQAEQRALLAGKLAEEFMAQAEGLAVAAFVLDFLRGPWAQVVAQARMDCTDGSDDPNGWRALVADLLWSAQESVMQRGRARRLAQMLPGLTAGIRQGLASLGWPPELTQAFLDNLRKLHEPQLAASDDALAQEAVETLRAVEAPQLEQLPGSEPQLSPQEAQDSGWIADDPLALGAAEAEEAASSPPPGLRTGTWADLQVDGQWLRVQLTWASPHGTLFMFTSMAGTAHSMSRRTLDRLRARGTLRIVAGRNVVDDAFDQVAQAALKNSLDGGG
jgi:predicted RNase H-like HicB family nuclease